MSSTTNASGPILKLGIRSNQDARDITVQLTQRSLLLVVLMGVAIVLMYEVVTFMICLLCCRGRTRDPERRHRYAGGHAPGRRGSNDKDRLPLTMSSSPKNTTTTTTTTLSATSKEFTKRTALLHRFQTGQPPVWLILLWTISTTYGVFYSFEVVFLYINDRWYQLLGLQLLLTTTDVLTWVWILAVAKHGILPHGSMPSVSTVCCCIKVLHLAFNVCVEADIWILRHWVFLLEDATYLGLAPFVLDCYWWESLRKPRFVAALVGVGLVMLLAVRSLPTMGRIT